MKKITMFLIAFVCFGLTMNAQVNLQNGLVAYYPFNGNANDESGNGNNGTVNGATLTTDRNGITDKAYHFEFGNFITIPSFPFSTYGNFTISMWVAHSEAHVNGEYYIFFGDGSDNQLGITINGSTTGIISFVANDVVTTPFDINNLDKYTHYLLKYENGILYGYINGLLQGSKSTSIGTLNSNSAIAKHWWNNGSESASVFKGNIDDIRIYNRALNDQEIGALYFASLSFDNQTVKVGRTIEIPVNTSELTTNENVIAYQFDFNYDNTKLEYIGNSLVGTLAEGGNINVNTTIAGVLSFGFTNTTAIVGTGAILKLQFKVLDAGTITPTITNAKFNETDITSISNGIITSTYLYGDVTANDEVTAYDAALTLQYSVGLDPLPTIDPLPWEAWRIKVADVDASNDITAIDASLILQYSVGLISQFPCQAKSLKNETGDVNITVENGELIFRSSGELFGLNVFVNENFAILGQPQILDVNMLSATNINETSYAIGLATPYSPAEGTSFMKIPVNANQNTSITFDMIINSTTKSVTVDFATGIVNISDKAIFVYPNPATDILSIKNANENSKISIYDLTGKQLINSGQSDLTFL